MIQVIKKPCCGVVFAACVDPECYTDKDWTTELSKYVKAGNVVEMVESSNIGGKCKCKTLEGKE